SAPCRMLYSRRWTSHPALHALTARRCVGQLPRRNRSAVCLPAERAAAPPVKEESGCSPAPPYPAAPASAATGAGYGAALLTAQARRAASLPPAPPAPPTPAFQSDIHWQSG